MTDKARVPLAEARQRAAVIVGLLLPHCDRIAIAGSIRREKPTIGDIEIVCVPKTTPTGLFGDGPPACDVTAECDRWLETGRASHRLDKNGRKSYGQKYKRLVFDGFALDLFSVVDPGSWGVILTIRTGSAEFSHSLVTPRDHGGRMPRGMSVAQGFLWRDGVAVPCLEEIDFFREIGLGWIDPKER